VRPLRTPPKRTQSCPPPAESSDERRATKHEKQTQISRPKMNISSVLTKDYNYEPSSASANTNPPQSSPSLRGLPRRSVPKTGLPWRSSFGVQSSKLKVHHPFSAFHHLVYTTYLNVFGPPLSMLAKIKFLEKKGADLSMPFMRNAMRH
jgi:hypothetical protein